MEFIVSGIYKWFKLVLIAALLSQHGFAMTNPIKCDGHDTSESHMSSNDSLSSVEHTTLNNHTLHSEKNQDVQHCEGNDQSICACCIGAYCATSLTQFFAPAQSVFSKNSILAFYKHTQWHWYLWRHRPSVWENFKRCEWNSPKCDWPQWVNDDDYYSSWNNTTDVRFPSGSRCFSLWAGYHSLSNNWGTEKWVSQFGSEALGLVFSEGINQLIPNC